jgi:sporulation protein YunB
MFRKKFKTRTFRKKGPLSTRQVFFITFLLFLATSLLSLSFVNQTVEPIIMNIAKTEINRIATEAIYESVDEYMGKINMEDFITATHSDSSSPTYSINPKTSISFRTNITKDIQSKLGIKQTNPFHSALNTDEQFNQAIYYIPLGVVTGNALLANYGPKIPVKMATVGHVESDFKTELTNSGINNTFLQLTVLFKVKMQIVIPSFSEETLVQQEINVGGILINGDVPSYYSNGTGGIAPAVMKPESEKK